MTEHDPRRRLGRGLAALIGESDLPQTPAQGPAPQADRQVPVELLQPNERNPRRHFDAADLAELAHSVAQHGVVQPILVRPVPPSARRASAKFEIIAGERRWRAAQQARLHKVPVIVREVSDREALELAIIENIQRADLNPIEEAAGYQQLLDEHRYSQAELGQVLGKSRSHIANTLRLLKLPDDVRELIVVGQLSAGHARAVITAEDPSVLARRIVEEGLTVRQAEALQQETAGASASNTSRRGASSAKNADIRALERDMEERLGLKVDISHRTDGSGTVRFRYGDLDQLDGLFRRLQAR